MVLQNKNKLILTLASAVFLCSFHIFSVAVEELADLQYLDSECSHDPLAAFLNELSETSPLLQAVDSKMRQAIESKSDMIEAAEQQGSIFLYPVGDQTVDRPKEEDTEEEWIALWRPLSEEIDRGELDWLQSVFDDTNSPEPLPELGVRTDTSDKGLDHCQTDPTSHIFSCNDREPDGESHLSPSLGSASSSTDTTSSTGTVPILSELIRCCKSVEQKMAELKRLSGFESPLKAAAKTTGADSAGFSGAVSYCGNREEIAGNTLFQRPVVPKPLPLPDDFKKYFCHHGQCSYSAANEFDLKIHLQTHTADREVTVYRCDYGYCTYSTYRKDTLTRHKRTHLPADQRVKTYYCDHDGCDYSAGQKRSLSNHKLTHLPADCMVYQCNHEGCDFRTQKRYLLRKHKMNHLTGDQRTKMFRCDHDACDYRASSKGALIRHTLTHRSNNERNRDFFRCGYRCCKFNARSRDSLIEHQLTHLSNSPRAKLYRCDHDGVTTEETTCKHTK